MMYNPPPAENVVEAIEKIVGETMRPFGCKSVRVHQALDHDDEPVLHIDVDYAKGGKPIDIMVANGLVSAIANLTWELGDSRFPHIRHHFLDTQKIVEPEWARQR